MGIGLHETITEFALIQEVLWRQLGVAPLTVACEPEEVKGCSFTELLPARVHLLQPLRLTRPVSDCTALSRGAR